ncbi:hypothetical protein C8R47DRAFT_1100364 [Mycena vitilis]|nr:hypothetical protein C8R47DRAFT_1100364 [Mycena vitilis]
MTTNSEISVLCTVTGHPDVFETVTFDPDGNYSGRDLVAAVQRCHNGQCDCATVLQDAWKVHLQHSDDLGLQLTSRQLENDPDTSFIDPLDRLSLHFPKQPNLDLVSIVCEAVSPPSPSSSSSSSGSKRSWSGSDDSESSFKQARTQSPSSAFQRLHDHTSSRFDSHPILPSESWDFPDFCTQSEVAFVDKTHNILGLSERYRHLLLRPPRFGKTTLLTTLVQYYDIHKAEEFSDDFGSLLVATTHSPHSHPPPPNRHLCLVFAFPVTSVQLDVARITYYVKDRILSDVESFLSEYAAELRVPDVQTFVQTHGDDLLKQTLDLAKKEGYTLFVGVDNYDAPNISRFFAHLYPLGSPDNFATRQVIETLLDQCLWAPLYMASDVIDKLFVTGTFLLQSSTLVHLDKLALTALPSSMYPCGFTEHESIDLSQLVLDEPPAILELRRLYGHYSFLDHTVPSECLLHPQRLISRLSESTRYSQQDTTSFHILSALFKVLPEDSHAIGTATVHGLIHLLATGAMEVVQEIGAPINVDDATVTWSILYYLGALTCDRWSKSTLRLTNDSIFSLIRSRISAVLYDRYDLGGSIFWTFHESTQAPIEVCDGALTDLLRDQSKRSYGSNHEPDLRGVLGLVLSNAHCTDTLDGSADLFGSQADSTRIMLKTSNDEAHTLELKTLSLLGMWRGQNPNEPDPSTSALQEFHEELIDDEISHLLGRPYAEWVSDLSATRIVSVQSFTDPDPDVPLMLAIGGAHIIMRTLDVRV